MQYSLIKTINGVQRVVLYYDPEIFNDKITLSASLIVGEAPQNLLGDIPFDATEMEITAFGGYSHYNTIHDEDAGTSGTNWQSLEMLGITIYPKPTPTKIIGLNRVEPNTVSQNYTLDPEYDLNNVFYYEWDIIDVENASVSIIGSNLNKNVDLTFGSTNGHVMLRCKISNTSGCYRYVLKRIVVGIVPKSILVMRNTYFK